MTKIRRIIEREPSRGRKVARAIGIAFLVLGIILALAGIGAVSGAVFILGIVLVIIGLIMMRAGRKKREVISEEEVSDEEEEEKEEQKSKDALANEADLLKSQSSKQKEELAATEPQLEPFEQVLWRRDITRGFFKKRVIQIQMVTNKAIRIDNDYAISIFQLDDIAVTNRHGKSEGSYTSYSTGGRRGGIRVGMGQGTGRSRRYGDVVFFVNGQAVLTFSEVEDPSGLVRLIKAAMKGQA